jgi:predicted nucleic acid-binding Zn ribbon protein
VMQRMTDDPLTVCEEHGLPVQRVFHPVAVHFKGSGFYNTDYGKKKSGASSSGEGSSSDGSSSKSESSSKSDTSSKPDAKTKDSGSSKSSSSSD